MTWHDVTYHTITITSKRIDRYLDAVRKTHVKGGAIFACFEPDDITAFDEAASMESMSMVDLALTFVTSPCVNEALPELDVQLPLDPIPDFTQIAVQEFQSELTRIVTRGGAYLNFKRPLSAARKLGCEFLDAIMQNPESTVQVAASDTPWTEWFCDIVWDGTYVIYDPGARRIWLLCVTDTD